MKFKRGDIVVLKSNAYTFITINDGELEVPNDGHVIVRCSYCIHNMNNLNYKWLETNKDVYYKEVYEPTEHQIRLFKDALAKENKYYCEKTKTIKKMKKEKGTKCTDWENSSGFTKKDLKSGMWVELRNGDRYMVIKDCETASAGKQQFCLITNNGYLVSDEYTDCLTCSYSECNEFDICAVYSENGDVVSAKTYTGENMSLVWRRNDKQEKIKAKIDEMQIIIDELKAELR